MNAIERTVRRFDAFQQSHLLLAFPYAVVKKFGDDQAGNLAALVAYYGFFSAFPLLLVFITILSHLVGANSGLLGGALGQFPVIGPQLAHHSLQGSGTTLVVGIIASLWGGRGAIGAMQTAMNTVWNVPMRRWPNIVTRWLRNLGVLAIFGVAVLCASLASGIGAGGSLAVGWKLLGFAVSMLINTGLYLLAFRILTAENLSVADVAPGAILAAAMWTALQALGGYLIDHELRGSSDVYGTFALVIGLLSWFFVVAQCSLFAAEVNVVLRNRLWPRPIVQPPLAGADERAYERYAKQQERRPEQRVEVAFSGEGLESHGGEDETDPQGEPGPG